MQENVYQHNFIIMDFNDNVLFANVKKYYGKLDYEFIHHKIILSHDGYDRYGPKSNLYDYIMWYKIKDTYYIDMWHTEQWYTKGEKLIYDLINKFCTKDDEVFEDTLDISTIHSFYDKTRKCLKVEL